MITYVKNDLFEGIKGKKRIIIPHVVNSHLKWGSGFVVPLGRHFPEAKNHYLNWKNTFGTDINSDYSFHLGNVQFINVGGLTEDMVLVANMLAQTFNEERVLYYSKLCNCMEKVANFAITNKLDIHAPKFGSGLARGNWSFIEELINEIWHEINVTIYEI